MVSRETFGVDLFHDLSNVWFSSFMRSKALPWELLVKDYKETWIRSQMRANVIDVPCNGRFVEKTTEIRVGAGVAVVEAGAYLADLEIELREGVVVEAGAWIAGPTILGQGTAIRHGAYVRGGILTGKDVVIGHTSEVKSSIFLNHAKAPHFAYVGDSILGNHVNLGAGTKLSNLKITNTEIKLRIGQDVVATGLRKMGAILGDHSETGCNSVLNPGVLLGKKCLVFPVTSVRPMYFKAETIIR